MKCRYVVQIRKSIIHDWHDEIPCYFKDMALWCAYRFIEERSMHKDNVRVMDCETNQVVDEEYKFKQKKTEEKNPDTVDKQSTTDYSKFVQKLQAELPRSAPDGMMGGYTWGTAYPTRYNTTYTTNTTTTGTIRFF